MTTSILNGRRDSPTPAVGVGAMYRSGVTATAVLIAVTASLESATASSYEVPLVFERTASGPAGQVGRVKHVSAESPGEAVLEIRRRSGLTWEELGELFGVSRRSVHHWASGKPASAGHDRAIRRMLAAIRHLDRGSQTDTRARLLAVDDANVTAFDLLKDGRFEEAMARAESTRAPVGRRTPLSRKAQDARRPPSPISLLGAEQQRPDIPANARAVRAARAVEKTA